MFQSFLNFFHDFPTSFILAFVSYNSNQAVIKYLLGQENLLVHTMQADARLHARWATVKMNDEIRIFAIFTVAIDGRAVLYVQPRARPHGAR